MKPASKDASERKIAFGPRPQSVFHSPSLLIYGLSDHLIAFILWRVVLSVALKERPIRVYLTCLLWKCRLIDISFRFKRLIKMSLTDRIRIVNCVYKPYCSTCRLTPSLIEHVIYTEVALIGWNFPIIYGLKTAFFTRRNGTDR